MEENKNSRIVDFLQKYWWIFTISFGICAILFLFLPILNYEIREALYDIATGERASKTDYVYSVNLVSYFTTKFHLNYTMYITIGIIVLGIGVAVIGIFKKEVKIASGIIFLIAICFFILAKEFFKSEENAVLDFAPVVTAGYDESKYTLDVSLHGVDVSWGTALGIAFSSLAFASTTLVDVRRTTRQIAEEGVLISLAFVLNFIKIPVGATGGSINFQMLPLMFLALRLGPAHGFIAGGIVYGLLTCLTDGYGFACYPFDYLIGFGSVGVMGFFRKFIFSPEQKGFNFKGAFFIFVGGVLSTLVRYIGSNVSSIVVYGLDLKGALVYNSFYIPLSGVAAIVPLLLIYGPLIKLNERFPVDKDLPEEVVE